GIEIETVTCTMERTVSGHSPNRTVAVFAAVSLVAVAASSAAEGPPIEKLKLPPGFRVSVYAYPVPGARSMTLGARGTLFVGTQDKGVVYAIVDADRNGQADSVRQFASRLDTPNGVAFRDGALYVAEVSRIR